MITITGLLILAALCAIALAIVAVPSRHTRSWTIDHIETLLPQTQCGACGYPGCRPYAKALLTGDARINQCAPGGDATVYALADLLGHDPIAMDPESSGQPSVQRVVIVEPVCIGCTKCIQACPVDAIVGAAKQMHTVIAERCTGCELCIAPCPVDCIEIVPLPLNTATWKWPLPTHEVSA